MADYLKDLEYYSSIHQCYVIGEIIDIDDENNYVMKNKKDSTEETCESNNIRKITNISSTPLNECVCEYIKNEDEFIEVEVKETKGLFCILEMEDEEGNQSSFLSRKNKLRYIEYLPLEDYIREKYVNHIFEIGPKLSEWVGSDRFNAALKKVYEDNENYKLFYTQYPSDSPNFLRILCSTEKIDRAKLLFGMAIQKENKIISLNQDTEKIKTQLNDIKKKNQKVFINQKFIGLIIGKEGANIKNLKNKYGVNITIDQKKDKKLTQVIIKGEDGDKVEECSKEINVCEKIYELSESSVGDLKKRTNKLLEDYKLKYFFISNEEKKDDDGNIYKAPNVTIIGNNEYIEELYNKEIKDYENYNNNNYSNNNYDNYDNNYDNNYGNNYKYSSGTSYRQSNKRNNNYYNYYQDNYKKYNKGYSTRNSYYK